MKIKRIIDLTQSFCEKGFNNPAFRDGSMTVVMEHKNAGWYAEEINTATHVGTHIDAPLHKIRGGKPINAYPLERFIGDGVPINLYDKKENEEITAKDFISYDSVIQKGDNVLLCTGWAERKKEESKDTYLHASPWLGASACRYLVGKGVNSVGIDHFSIGGANSEHVEIPHDLLLHRDILIIEGLYLPRQLFERERWTLIAFPLLMEYASGSPARVAAVEWE
ncbi:MAG: cyclase family protein [Eubacteriales bacterium]